MTEPLYIERVAAPPPIPTGEMRCGVAEVDVTPHVGLPMAGYSLAGKVAQGARGRLFARALYLEDAAGRRAALCILDLHSASRYVLERAAAETAVTAGISVDRLLVAGTHTHTGPGQFYGNSLYDAVAQCTAGFDQGWADWLADRVAHAVTAAARAAVPARVGIAVNSLWGVARNRSLPAFACNRDAAHWHASGWPGAGVPEGLSAEQRAVDPRVTVVVATRRETGTLLGAFATFGCHATCLGLESEVYAPDWAGPAVREARRLLTPIHGSPPVIAVAASAAGDINALQEEVDQGPALARWVGGRVGRAMAEAAQAARSTATDLDLEVRYAEPLTRDRQVDGRMDTELADHWCLGASTLGGSEDGRTLFHELALVEEGMTSDFFRATDPPQVPKAPAIGWLQPLVSHLAGLDPTPALPMHALRLGTHFLVTVPGEPTAMAAHRIERAVQAATGASGVTVLGYAADYGGYYTTEEEYEVQHYEGASTLYGRHAARHLEVRLEALVTRPAAAPVGADRVAFHTGPPVTTFSPVSTGGGDPTHLRVTRKGRRVEVRWQMPATVQVVLAEGDWVCLEECLRGKWQPLEHDGLPFNDVTQEIEIIRRPDPFSWLSGQVAWRVRLQLPWEPSTEQCLRVRVAPRAQFPGFTREIP